MRVERGAYRLDPLSGALSWMRSLWGARSLWSSGICSPWWLWILVCLSRRAFGGFDARDIAYEDNRLTWSIHRKDEQAVLGDPFIVRRANREGGE